VLTAPPLDVAAAGWPDVDELAAVMVVAVVTTVRTDGVIVTDEFLDGCVRIVLGRRVAVSELSCQAMLSSKSLVKNRPHRLATSRELTGILSPPSAIKSISASSFMAMNCSPTRRAARDSGLPPDVSCDGSSRLDGADPEI